MTLTETTIERFVALKNKFGARLKSLRKEAGLTQPELAQEVGVTQSAISQLETGATEPTWVTVQALCVALGVNCDEFWTDDDPAPRRGRPRKPRNTEGDA